MGSTINDVAHGFVAGDTIYFANLVPSDCGIVEGQTYYVLAVGLTANAFQFSETLAGTAFNLTFDITDGVVRRTPVYTAVTDPTDPNAPPVAPGVPGSCVLTSAAVVSPDGTVVTKLIVTITQPTSATLRHTIVTVSGGSNAVQVVIPVGSTVGTIASVTPGVSYTGVAIAYDTFGLASGTRTSSAHVAAGDVTAPATPTGLAVAGAILGVVATWASNTEADLSHYVVAVSTDGGATFPTTLRTRSNLVTIGELSAGVKTLKVQAVDLSGNASAFSSNVAATSRLTDLVTNSTAKVTIDSSGLTIVDGNLTIQDAFGKSVLGASGVSGSWSEFIAQGLYNGAFNSGTTGVLANGRTAALPYWDAENAVGSPVLAYENDASHKGLKFTFAALNNAKSILSDKVPVTLDRAYNLHIGANYTRVAGDLYIKVEVLEYDSAATFLTSTEWSLYDADHRTVFASTGSGAKLNEAGVGFLSGPLEASQYAATNPNTTHIAVKITVTEGTAHNAGNIVRITGVAFVPEPQSLLNAFAESFGSNSASISDLTVDALTVNASLTTDVAAPVVIPGLLTLGGSAFPVGPTTDDLFYRTDLDMWFFYDGTRWLSSTLYEMQVMADPTATWPFAATVGRGMRASVPSLHGGSDLYLIEHKYDFFVNAGTALGASHKWVGTLDKAPTGNVVATIVTDTIASGTSTVWRTATDALNVLLNSGTAYFELSMSWTKTGTPGNLFIYSRVSYRIVAT